MRPTAWRRPLLFLGLRLPWLPLRSSLAMVLSRPSFAMVIPRLAPARVFPRSSLPFATAIPRYLFVTVISRPSLAVVIPAVVPVQPPIRHTNIGLGRGGWMVSFQCPSIEFAIPYLQNDFSIKDFGYTKVFYTSN